MGVRSGGSEPLLLLFIRRKGLEEVLEEWQARLESRCDGQEQLLFMGVREGPVEPQNLYEAALKTLGSSVY